MSTDMNQMQTFIRAGLRQREVAELLGVCRASVNRWYKGHTEPSHLLTDRLTEFTANVNQLVDAGTLPLNPDLTPEERLPKLQELIGEQADE